MKFSVPAVITISGWILIEAESLEAAEKEANRLNEEGVEESALNDTSVSSEVNADELEKV